MTAKSLLPLLIVTPMRIEARALRSALDGVSPSRAALTCVAAVGEAADAPFSMLIEQRRPGAVLLAGFAGALDPSLTAGSLVLAAAHRHDSHELPASMTLLDLADRAARHRGLPHRTGILLTSPAAVMTAGERAAAHAATGAVGVEMEGYRLGEIAARTDTPFLGVRAISDGATDVIPAYVAAAASGGTFQQVRRIVPGLARRPADIPTIARLTMNTRVASRNLARFVEAFLDELT